MKASLNGPIIGQKRDLAFKNKSMMVKQSIETDTFVPANKRQSKTSFKGFCDYCCGKPLMLFWNPHSSESLDYIVEQNDVCLAKELVTNGSLNNFPKVRKYLVQKIVKNIGEAEDYLEKVHVLKALNALPELIKLGIEKQEPIYDKLVSDLQGMVALFK